MIRPGLERIRAVLARLGHPEDAFAAALVAGTNGKGSVAALLDSTLRTGGLRAGLYTSPHLIDVRERVRVDGPPLAAGRWRRLAGRVASAGRGLGLTEFEAQTALAFLAFAEAGADIAVLEIGLGGRWDATNAHPAPEVTVLSSIGMDHREWLGPTLRHIYREKRAVGRPGTVMVQNIPRAFWAESDRWSAAAGVPTWTLGRELRAAAIGRKLSVRGPGFAHAGLPLALAGPHQVRNAALAAGALEVLARRGWPVSASVLRRGFGRTRWPGRFDVVRARGPVVVDGAHNADAARALARAWRASPWGRRKATLYFGCLKDKDASAMVRALAPVASRVNVLTLPTPRARPAEALRALWARRRPTAVVDAAALASPPPGPVLVTGSLYLAGEAIKIFRGPRSVLGEEKA